MLVRWIVKRLSLPPNSRHLRKEQAWLREKLDKMDGKLDALVKQAIADEMRK